MFKMKLETTLQVVSFEGNMNTDKIPDAVREFLNLPLDWTKGIVLSGRGPVRFFSELIHTAHPAAWVGTFEPRQNDVIVVQRHTETSS